jgi:hypothetical protein
MAKIRSLGGAPLSEQQRRIFPFALPQPSLFNLNTHWITTHFGSTQVQRLDLTVIERVRYLVVNRKAERLAGVRVTSASTLSLSRLDTVDLETTWFQKRNLPLPEFVGYRLILQLNGNGV